MSNEFTLSCESTVDLPFSYIDKRNLSVIFYTYVIDGTEYTDDMGRNVDALNNLYRLLDEGKTSKTSLINYYTYYEYFDKLLQKGDLLHITLGSGMTSSVNNAVSAANDLRNKYPDRKIFIVDSFCSSSGYGLLIDTAADMRDKGDSIEDIYNHIMKIRKKIHHCFFCTDLRLLKYSGRVSGPAGTIATVLGICPIMHLDNSGKIIAYGRARGKRQAIEKTVSEMLENADGGKNYSGKCFVSHSQCPELATQTVSLIEQTFPNLAGNIKIFDIGTIIASHCGRGTTAVFFLGDVRT